MWTEDCIQFKMKLLGLQAATEFLQEIVGGGKESHEAWSRENIDKGLRISAQEASAYETVSADMIKKRYQTKGRQSYKHSNRSCRQREL